MDRTFFKGPRKLEEKLIFVKCYLNVLLLCILFLYGKNILLSHNIFLSFLPEFTQESFDFWIWNAAKAHLKYLFLRAQNFKIINVNGSKILTFQLFEYFQKFFLCSVLTFQSHCTSLASFYDNFVFTLSIYCFEYRVKLFGGTVPPNKT